MEFLSDKDKSDLLFGIGQNVDFIAASFVRTVDDVRDLRAFLKENGGASYDDAVTASIETVQAEAAGTASTQDAAAMPDDGRDEYFAEAGRFVIDKQKGSIGMLQRIFKIGFNRAARIMDQLAEAGVVGPEVGTKPRQILMTMEEFENFLNGNN
jgi:S-DNA-T family DNA segregation ATPase FtsK/SpoIIIE